MHPQDATEDLLMDLDDDFETGGSKLTCPGESLTSAQTFMRWVSRSPAKIQMMVIIPQRSRYVCR